MTKPIRILVVHSDSADLAVIASVAAAQSFELRVLESHADLVAEAESYWPDAVILDVKQREGDGFTLCAALKGDQRTTGIPVVLVSAADDPTVRRRAIAAGCDDFLAKPIQRDVLAHRLHSFARLRRAWLEQWVELPE